MSTRAHRPPLVRATTLCWSVLLVLSCQPPTGNAPGPAEGSDEGHVDGSGEGSGQPGSAAQIGDPAAGDDASLACATSADCRVMQPSDWSARVECCYEYPCDLDYVAINQTSWEQLRAWQLAHPFDCAAHLQSEGPCDARPTRCGLAQEPPGADCISGRCEVAWPRPWPRVDADAQTCAVASDCRPWRTTAVSEQTRCCEADCGTDWIAINESTRVELVSWMEAHPVDCDAILASDACESSRACTAAAPGVACVAGLCAVR